jgi:hypothetical protein
MKQEVPELRGQSSREDLGGLIGACSHIPDDEANTRLLQLPQFGVSQA